MTKSEFKWGVLFVLIVFAALMLVRTDSLSASKGTMFATTSGEQTADAAILARTGAVASVQVITDGTNNAKLILYDNASAASGTVIFEMTVIGADHKGQLVLPYPEEVDNGIFADVSGTGASYIVGYIDKRKFGL